MVREHEHRRNFAFYVSVHFVLSFLFRKNWAYKPVSQSCAVAKSDKFWRATGQSNLADRMEDCPIGQSAAMWVRKQNFLRFCCGQPLVCQVWLSNGPPEFVTFSYSLPVSLPPSFSVCFCLCLFVYRSVCLSVWEKLSLSIFSRFSSLPPSSPPSLSFSLHIKISLTQGSVYCGFVAIATRLYSEAYSHYLNYYCGFLGNLHNLYVT